MSLKKGNRSQLELRVQFNSGEQKKNEESLPTFVSLVSSSNDYLIHHIIGK